MFFPAILTAITLLHAVSAALSLGCYTQGSRHSQVSGSPDHFDVGCITFCQGYFPGRSYAYWWQEYERSEGYVSHCWCTNHMPEARFVTPQLQPGDCATDGPTELVTDISVYLIRPIDGWTD
ncbi:hypothetical protein IAT40_007264 [Kwoniella sp. CBS 6097]